MIAAALETDRATWLGDAVATIHSLSMSQEIVTADDLRRELGASPSPYWPGIAFSMAKKAGYIEAVNHITSTARSRKHGSLRTWAAVKDES
jgi:hypothetical protein